MKSKKPASTKHYGKETGYDLIDGCYHIAPMYSRAMDELIDEERGLTAFVQQLSTYLTSHNKNLAKRKRDWWRSVESDLGIDFSKIGEYQYSDGVISPIEDKPPKEEVK